MMPDFLMQLFGGWVFSTIGIIENPVIHTVEFDSPFAGCISEEINKQVPEGIVSGRSVYVMGPSYRRDVVPKKSVIELLVMAPNAKPYPKNLTMSLWLETPDGSEWNSEFLENGTEVYRAAKMINPGKVFDRVQYRHLFDFDFNPCL